VEPVTNLIEFQARKKKQQKLIALLVVLFHQRNNLTFRIARHNVPSDVSRVSCEQKPAKLLVANLSAQLRKINEEIAAGLKRARTEFGMSHFALAQELIKNGLPSNIQISYTD
jgi:hypothetical protein